MRLILEIPDEVVDEFRDEVQRVRDLDAQMDHIEEARDAGDAGTEDIADLQDEQALLATSVALTVAVCLQEDGHA